MVRVKNMLVRVPVTVTYTETAMERGKVGDEKTYRYASTVGLRGRKNIERLIISDESAKDALTTYKNGRMHKTP
jgi:hypothetical protein